MQPIEPGLESDPTTARHASNSNLSHGPCDMAFKGFKNGLVCGKTSKLEIRVNLVEMVV